MLGISIIDWIVIAGYLFLVALIGLRSSRHVKSASSFFISDRSFGKVIMALFTFAMATSSDHAVVVSAKSFRVGASGVWYQWLYLFATPFYWLIAPLFRRMRAVTTADYFNFRYGKPVGRLYAIVAFVQLMLGIGILLKSAAAIMTAVSGGGISTELAIPLMTVLFVAYGIVGGLNAVILTDIIHGVFTFVFAFLLLPFALNAVGGMSGLRDSFGRATSMFDIVAAGNDEISFFCVAILSLNALVGIATQPETMGKGGAGRTEFDSRVGFLVGSLSKRICTIPWVLTGMCAVVIFSGKQVEGDHVYGLMARELISPIGYGLIGLFLSALLADLMSSCDAKMVLAAGLFTREIYQTLFRSPHSERHCLLVGKICSATIVLMAVFIAFGLPSVIRGVEVFWMVSAMMGIPFWVGLFWRRATAAGAIAGPLAGLTVWFFTSDVHVCGCEIWNFSAAFSGHLPHFMFNNDNGEAILRMPWQMFFYLSAGFLTCVLVSLCTKPADEKKLDQFYACLRTPVLAQEPETAPFTLPEGMTPTPRMVLVQNPHFEIPKPSKISLLGFAGGCLAVVFLICAFYSILNL